MTHLWPAQEEALGYISSPPSVAWCTEKRTLVVLGSTGSIGKNALRVVESQAHLFDIVALAGAKNIQLLAEQATRFRPPYVGVFDAAGAELLRTLLPQDYTPHIVYGQEGYTYLARLTEANTVLSAQVGAAGLRATVAAALTGKVICLANKEALVLAGGLIREICVKTKASILPVDSEHNALFQALAGRPAQHVKRLVLTASGGPFRGYSREQLQYVTREQALKHPNWHMGAKISIDSATLMNKGLEVIEAFHLYGLAAERIAVVVHPESIIHSLVEFMDGSLIAHLGTADMRMPIAHCLAWPHCVESGVAALDLVDVGNLTFCQADIHSFPCLGLAQRALRELEQQMAQAQKNAVQDVQIHVGNIRGGQSIVLNAANEIAVELFLQGHIAFMDIPALLEKAMDAYAMDMKTLPTMSIAPFAVLPIEEYAEVMLQAIMELDSITRHKVRALAGL